MGVIWLLAMASRHVLPQGPPTTVTMQSVSTLHASAAFHLAASSPFHNARPSLQAWGTG